MNTEDVFWLIKTEVFILSTLGGTCFLASSQFEHTVGSANHNSKF